MKEAPQGAFCIIRSRFIASKVENVLTPPHPSMSSADLFDMQNKTLL